jgi:hypothetical protein
MQFLKRYVALIVAGLVLIVWALVLVQNARALVAHSDLREAVQARVPTAYEALSNTPAEPRSPFPETELREGVSAQWSRGPAAVPPTYSQRLLAPPKSTPPPPVMLTR